jgi:GTP-binding protein LepA
MTDGTMKELHNPADMPDVMKIDQIEEPWIKATILTPDEYLGSSSSSARTAAASSRADLCRQRAMVVYDLPLNEVVFDFYDRLKSITKGYASFDYQIDRLPRGRSREDVDPGQRRAGRCAVDDRPPRRAESAAAPCARS